MVDVPRGRLRVLLAALLMQAGDLIRLRSLAARHPLRERFHGQLMLALYRCDRQAEALAAYQRARDALVAELGVEPGPGLRDLHKRMLSGNLRLSIINIHPATLARPATKG